MFLYHLQVTHKDCKLIIISKNLNVYNFLILPTVDRAHRGIERAELLTDDMNFVASETLKNTN